MFYPILLPAATLVSEVMKGVREKTTNHQRCILSSQSLLIRLERKDDSSRRRRLLQPQQILLPPRVLRISNRPDLQLLHIPRHQRLNPSLVETETSSVVERLDNERVEGGWKILEESFGGDVGCCDFELLEIPEMRPEASEEGNRARHGKRFQLE